jgi:hypothetical protein
MHDFVRTAFSVAIHLYLEVHTHCTHARPFSCPLACPPARTKKDGSLVFTSRMP